MAYEHKGEFQVEHGFGLPVKTTAERTAYTPPQDGYQVYDSTLQTAFVYANNAWVELASTANADSKVSKAGDTMTGELVLSGDPTAALGASPRQFVEAQDALQVSRAGDSMSGTLDMSDNQIIGLPATPNATGATSVEYVNGLAVNYATAAQGLLADSALQDLTTSSISTLSDVTIDSNTIVDGQALLWDSASGQFIPTDVTTELGNYVTLDGDQDISSNKTFVSSGSDYNGLEFVYDGTSHGKLTIDPDGGGSLLLGSDTNSGMLMSGSSTFIRNAQHIFASSLSTVLSNSTNSQVRLQKDYMYLSYYPSGQATRPNEIRLTFAEDAAKFYNSVELGSGQNGGDVSIFSYTNDPSLDNRLIFGVKAASVATEDGDDDDTLVTKKYILDKITDVGTNVSDNYYTKTDSDGDAGEVGAKINKISAGIQGNFPAIDSGGELTDSGKTISDFATAAQGLLANTAVQPEDSVGTLIDVDLTTAATGGQALVWNGSAFAPADVELDAYSRAESDGPASENGDAGAKTDKVFGATDGNFAGLDASGNLTDSGAKTADFATAAQGAKADDAVQHEDSVGSLSDVDLTGITNDDVLSWDGSKLAPYTISTDYVTLATEQDITGAKTFINDSFLLKNAAGTTDVISFLGGTVDFGVKATSPATVTEDGDNTLTTKKFVEDALVATASVLELDDLTDVDNTTAASGNVLIHDGDSYKNRGLVFADVDGVASFAQGALADSAVQPGDATSLLTNNDAFVDVTTDQISIAGAKTFTDDMTVEANLTVSGNLVVSGTTTSVNSTNTEIEDSIITLNKGEEGAGVTNPNQSGLEIERGTAENKFLIWSEANDRFGHADLDATATANGDGTSIVDATSFEAFAYQSDVDKLRHVESFDTGAWTTGTPNTLTVTQATHGVTASDIYDVTVFDGTNKVGIEVSVNAAGDVTLITAGAVFAGRVKISL